MIPMVLICTLVSEAEDNEQVTVNEGLSYKGIKTKVHTTFPYYCSHLQRMCWRLVRYL